MSRRIEDNQRRRIHRLIALVEENKDEASYLEAVRYLDQLLEKGDDPELLRWRGYLVETRGAGLIREALGLYERSIELDPSAANGAHHQLIAAHGRLLRHQDAIDIYKARVESAPEDVAEYSFLCQAYMAAGEYDDAEKVIEAGLKLDPEHAGLTEGLACLYSHRGRHEDALATWQRALELEPESISSHYSRVFLLQRLGRLEQAIAEWEAIIAWQVDHDFLLHTEWPKREIAQLRAALDAQTPG